MEESKDCVVNSNADRDLSVFESKDIKFNKKFKDEESITGLDLTFSVVPNAKRNGFQVYLTSEASNKPIMLPVFSDNEEKAIQNGYNLLCELLDKIADYMEADSPE